ncbi:hypothetical protein Thiowin_03382 [Thiorhodovibrio winogradskyi]|uniref:DUF29 domain-containing protein n=1 Tax=Thiorhodovibrio winogradskyi TaxID=77007 RepID=A0ABZ0SDY0_9GAMM|nr:DUF29 domain-containing protein [Thiorhodovibrio winogradskyi]
MSIAADYDLDFHEWITLNVELLRHGRLSEIDAEHISEELESIGKRDLRQLRSRLQVLVMHLLKWQYQPERQGTSWLKTIDHQRDEIEAILLDSPSLRGTMPAALQLIYPKAVRSACHETELPVATFPESCPYLLDEILDAAFLPSGSSFQC